jgi:hypothetical protein
MRLLQQHYTKAINKSPDSQKVAGEAESRATLQAVPHQYPHKQIYINQKI